MNNPKISPSGYLNYCSEGDIISVMETYWERLRRLRESQGISKEQLAQRAKVTASYIYRIEKGDVATPSYQTAKALATALGISTDDLMGDSDPESATGDSWLNRLIEEFAPNTPPDEVRQFLAYVNRLDEAGRKAARAMLLGLSQDEGGKQERRAEG